MGPPARTLALGLLAACSGAVVQDDARPIAPPGTPPASSPDAPPGSGGPAPGPAPGLPAACRDGNVHPGTAPLRRLTRFEYDNTIRDLLGDDSAPARELPAEELGNGFGNDARAQAVSSLLAEQYAAVAERIAARATVTPAALARLAACAPSVNPASERSCARTIVTGLAPRAFRRPLAGGEADDLLALYDSARALPAASFATAIGAVIEALLNAPEFLYRIELGVPDPAQPGRRRPNGDEMATRLAYFLWGTMPDDVLRAAARTGELGSADGVLGQARRMLEDPRARRVVRFFFDNLLPIVGLSDLDRDRTLYPRYTPAIGTLLREETQRLIEHEIFAGSGTWPGILTAPHTFVDPALAAYHGLSGVSGTGFRKVAVDATQRLGVLTQASVMAGTTHSNHTNPVVRGAFVVGKLLCLEVPPPDASLSAMIQPPDPGSAKTGRERFSRHSSDPACRSCHAIMDPVGFALENYDAIGLFRTHEDGAPIDPRGALPGDTITPVAGPVELARALATSPAAQGCFALQWLRFASGKSLAADDACVEADLKAAFSSAGHDVKKLLLALTQTDAFLYLPPEGPPR